MSGCIWWAAWTSHGGLPGRLTVTPGQLTVLGNGSSLSHICRSRWGCLQSLRVQTIHTGRTVDVSLNNDTTLIGNFLRGCRGVNSRMPPGDVGFVENTLKASLSKSMWDTRVTTGAYHERDRGQFFYGCYNGSTQHV